MDDVCSVTDAAAHFGVSARTIERWLKRGSLRSRRVGGGRLIAWADMFALEGAQPAKDARADHMAPLLSLEQARNLLGAPNLDATRAQLAERRVRIIAIGRLERVSQPALRAGLCGGEAGRAETL